MPAHPSCSDLNVSRTNATHCTGDRERETKKESGHFVDGTVFLRLIPYYCHIMTVFRGFGFFKVNFTAICLWYLFLLLGACAKRFELW